MVKPIDKINEMEDTYCQVYTRYPKWREKYGQDAYQKCLTDCLIGSIIREFGKDLEK